MSDKKWDNFLSQLRLIISCTNWRRDGNENPDVGGIHIPLRRGKLRERRKLFINVVINILLKIKNFSVIKFSETRPYI